MLSVMLSQVSRHQAGLACFDGMRNATIGNGNNVLSLRVDFWIGEGAVDICIGCGNYVIGVWFLYIIHKIKLLNKQILQNISWLRFYMLMRLPLLCHKKYEKPAYFLSQLLLPIYPNYLKKLLYSQIYYLYAFYY